MVKRILFIGLSSVGDVVMTTPVLKALHEKYPDARFDIVTDKRSIALYKHVPFKDQLYIKDKNKFLRGVPDLLFALWKQSYDIIVDVRTDGLAYLLRGKKKYTKWHAKRYGEHAVEDLLGVISDLHGNAPIPNTSVWLNDVERAYAGKQISVFNKTDKLLALSVGDPDKPVKTWGVNKFVELINFHKKDFSGLIFLGGKTEYENTLKVINNIDTGYINMTGNALLESAALLERAYLYIGPDSGLGHIASAVKTPTITFFSGMAPERFRPWGDKAICIRGSNNDARNILVKEVSNAVRSVINE